MASINADPESYYDLGQKILAKYMEGLTSNQGGPMEIEGIGGSECGDNLKKTRKKLSKAIDSCGGCDSCEMPCSGMDESGGKVLPGNGAQSGENIIESKMLPKKRGGRKPKDSLAKLMGAAPKQANKTIVVDVRKGLTKMKEEGGSKVEVPKIESMKGSKAEKVAKSIVGSGKRRGRPCTVTAKAKEAKANKQEAKSGGANKKPSAWMAKVNAYRKEHGASMKEAMMALKGK